MKKNNYILYFVLMTIIVVAGSFNSFVISRDVKALSEARVESEADAIEYSMSNWVGEHLYFFENIKDIIDNFSQNELMYTHTHNKYLLIRFAERKMSEFYIGFENGQFTTGTEWVPPAGYDARLRPWYLAAKHADKTVFCEPYIDAKTGLPVTTLSSPFYSNGKQIGVIGLDLQLIEVNKFMQGFVKGSDYQGIIFNKNGTIMANTANPETIGKSVLNGKDKSLLMYYKAAFGQQAGEIVSINRSSFFLARKIENTDWALALVSMNNKTIKSADIIVVRNIILNLVFIVVSAYLLLQFFKTGEMLKQANKSLHEKIDELNDAKHIIEITNASLDKKSKTDGLTGVNNRGYFNEYVEKLWGECLSNKQTLSMIMLDIDHFKKYNDFYGHQAGDNVLISVCDKINSLLGEGDFFARYGGEEFTVISVVKNAEEMLHLADSIRLGIYDLNIEHVKSSWKRITVSLGVNTHMPSADDTIGNFIHKTDQALYQSKMSGRNRVHVYVGSESIYCDKHDR